MGTRFYASTEALGHERAKARIVAASGGETTQTRIFDIVRGFAWPEVYPRCALRNGFLDR